MNLIEQIRAWIQGEPKLYLNAPSWEFSRVWNESLTARPERPPRPRDYVWASEIGGSMIDRYLRMTGVAQTNPPNDRSLRKFQAADIWEWIVAFVLKRAGILVESQEKLTFQYPGLLPVVGKLDHLAGGKPNWKRARKEVSAIGLPEIIQSASLAIIDRLQERYGDDPIRTMVVEVKSLSSFMFERYEKTQKADPRHAGQLFHYLKAKPLSEGHVVYVCRDDCRIVELPIFNPSEVEQVYIEDIERITTFIREGTMPAKEKELLFDDLTFKFRTNWKVEYSGYLTLLYGYKAPIHYREAWDKSVAQFNRTFTRCVSGARMTDLNLKTIENAKRYFSNWDTLVEKAKIAAKEHPEILSEEAEAA